MIFAPETWLVGVWRHVTSHWIGWSAASAPSTAPPRQHQPGHSPLIPQWNSNMLQWYSHQKPDEETCGCLEACDKPLDWLASLISKIGPSMAPTHMRQWETLFCQSNALQIHQMILRNVVQQLIAWNNWPSNSNFKLFQFIMSRSSFDTFNYNPQVIHDDMQSICHSGRSSFSRLTNVYEFSLADESSDFVRQDVFLL